MRWVACVLFSLALMPSALAQDFLRGSEPVGNATFTNWSGFYGGGFAGMSDSSADFSNATSSIVAYALRETTLEDEFFPSQWQVLGTADDRALTYGGFIGYNTQWQDLILGIEADYNRGNFTLTAPTSPIGRITPTDSNGNTYLVDIVGAGTLTDLQFGTLRARAGLDLGSFLPYGFAGLALGHANIAVTADVAGEVNPPSSGPCLSTSTPACSVFAYSGSNSQGELLYGFTVGGGLDFAVTQNIFLRGELEYIRFAPIDDILVTIVSARAGAGIKF